MSKYKYTLYLPIDNNIKAGAFHCYFISQSERAQRSETILIGEGYIDSHHNDKVSCLYAHKVLLMHGASIVVYLHYRLSTSSMWSTVIHNRMY